MKLRYWIVVAALPFLAGWGDRDLGWPHAGPAPDDPSRGGSTQYKSITADTRTFRPVEPLSWYELNRRVAPRGTLERRAPSEPAPKNGKDATPPKAAPSHKH